MRAQEGDASFWTGNKTLDTSQGVGLHGDPVAMEKAGFGKGSSIKGKYVGKFEDVKIYESKKLGAGNLSGGVTLPPDTIIVGKGVYNLLETSEYVQDLLHHEFGHILQSRQPFVGIRGFYKVIAPESALSAYLDGKIIAPPTWTLHSHNNFWTETWANKLSRDYFGNIFHDFVNFRGEPLGLVNFLKFLAP